MSKSDKKGIFSWGYVDNVSNINMAWYFSPYLRNARLDWQSIIIRPWHTLFEELATGSYPKGIWSYLRAVSTNDVLVVRHNQDTTKKLVTLTELWTLTAIDTSTNITSDNRMNFINVWDVVYCMNGVDWLGKLDWTTYSVQSQTGYKKSFFWIGLDDLTVITSTGTTHTYNIEITGAWTPDTFKWNIDWWAYTTWVSITWTNQTLWTYLTIKFWATTGHYVTDKYTIITWLSPSFGVIFNSSMFVAWWSWAPDTVFKSVWNVYNNFYWVGSDSFDFSESITWLATTNQALFYFTKNSIAVTATSDIVNTAWVFSYSNRALATVEWAYNHECIVSVWNNVYYLNSAIQINQIATGENINGFEVLPLSQRPNAWITKIMESLDRDQTGSYWEYVSWPSLVKRHLKSVGSSFPDVVIVYDTIKDSFLVDSNKYMYGWVDFHQKHYSISAIEPKVFIDEYWQDDEDSPIPFEYWTKEYYITDPTLKKLLWESRTLLDINELTSCEQSIWIDWAQKDSKIIDKNSLTTLNVWWIWTDTIGENMIWDDGETNESKDLINSDYQEVYILRTKWNLNVKGRRMQWRFINNTLAGKVRLKNIMAKIEQLDQLTTPLTADSL